MKRSHSLGFSNEGDCETRGCWDDSITESISKKLFLDVWCDGDEQQNRQVMIQEHLLLLEREDFIQLARWHFDRGYYWLHMGQFRRALIELRKALALYDRTPVVADTSVESQQDFLERKAKCHYALGLVLMAISQMSEAEEHIYHAWRISANYEEMESMSLHAEQLMEVTLTHKWGAPEAHCRVTSIKNAIVHEVSADHMYASGSLLVAMVKYQKCLYWEEEKESHLRIAQAHIRCKLAMICEALGRLEEASNEWITALSIYQSELGPDHSRTQTILNRCQRSQSCSCSPLPLD